ncbi:MAG: GbsR/MarR family transcriptional regulator [Pikeienuella sp.]
MAAFTKSEQAFILNWGDAVAGWGFGRSVGRIHAALLLNEEPISADEICDLLGVARSNVSMSLKELIAAGLVVKTAPAFGQRKETFSTLMNAGDTAHAIANHIQARSLAPMINALAEVDAESQAGKRLSDLQAIELTVSSVPSLADGSRDKPKKKKKKKGKG